MPDDSMRHEIVACGHLLSIIGIPEYFRSWEFDVRKVIAIYVGQEPVEDGCSSFLVCTALLTPSSGIRSIFYAIYP